MLAKRVILQLCFLEGVLFRTKRFVPDLRYTQAYSCADDADQVVLIDITPQKWPGFPKLVETYGRRLDIPLVVGGHVDSVGYALQLMNAGSFGVVVGWKYRSIYEKIAYRVGSQSLTAGIDIGNEGTRGLSMQDGIHACREAVGRGAGEILLTSVERDGSLAGYDLSTLRTVCASCHVPVVVAGGCGSWSHIKAAFEAGAQGAATSNIFHLNATAMRSCKQWLTSNYKGPIRPAAVGMIPKASADTTSTVAADG